MQNCLMRYADQALYYPSSAEKIGRFFFPSVALPFRGLGFNRLGNFWGGVPFSQKDKRDSIMWCVFGVLFF